MSAGAKYKPAGELGPIVADATGVAKGLMTSKLVKLKGASSVMGRSMKVTSDSGARVASGEIKAV